ncbi:M20/M25/M40 family metallo-hydrolase [Nakamurella sp. A5-74]|uniref:M20/M25/M40 family metallo-hydrolase n=1 Tax=Nakamurella sp. A5-74 TaxID=3158264 RepID=A0AAU8DMX1_9ACTN
MTTTPQPPGEPVSTPSLLDQRAGASLDQSGSATVEAVRQWVADHRDEVLAELAAWVAVRSVSSSGEGFPEATDAAREMLARNGFDARIVPTDGHPAVIGELSGVDPDAPHVLVYGHYDVQATGPRELWSSDPWETEIRDGRIFGRGTADNKGQHLAQILAIRALREVGAPSPCRLTLVLDGEEEIGSPHLPAVLDTITDRPDLSLWSDGPVHASGRWTVSLGVRGIVIFTLTARGATSGPLHSGHWGGVAPNPAWRLVQLLATMRSPDGVSLVEGLEDGVLPLTAAEQDALAALPLDLPTALASAGITDLEPPAALTYYQRLTRPTFSINSLTCHDTQDHRTIIPDTATARCDIRMVGGQRSAHVIEALRAHVQRYAPDIELEAAESMEPARTLPESRWTQAVLAGALAGFGEEPVLTPALGGSLPIAALADAFDIPSYGLPLANVDERNHAPDENLMVEMFLAGITAAAAVNLALATEGRAGNS